MAIKQFKPYTPGRRFMTVQKNDDLTRKDPERSLLEPLHKKGGRNNRGRITMRHRGGGTRRLYRSSTSRGTSSPCPEKSPPSSTIRTGTPALPSFIILTVKSGTSWLPRTSRSATPSWPAPESDIRPGNALKLKDIPVGTMVHTSSSSPAGAESLSARQEHRPSSWQKKESTLTSVCPAVSSAHPQNACHHRPGRKRRLRNVSPGKAGKTLAGQTPMVRVWS